MTLKFMNVATCKVHVPTRYINATESEHTTRVC